MAKWNVGIIGYGWVAGAHIAALNQVEETAVTAVCSSRPLDAAALSARHGGPITVYHQFEDLLADPRVNIVSLCSRNPLHAPQAIAAARAGKHLIIEKPIALNWEDCLAIQRAVDAAGVHTCVCFEVRYSGQFTMTRSLIDRGVLGKLHLGEVDYYHGIGPQYGQYRWNVLAAEGGSSLLSAGCHAMDGLLMFMGGEVTEVFSYATGSAHPDYARYEYPTTSVTVLRFADGAVGKVSSSIDAIQPYHLRVHLFGSAGSLREGELFTQTIPGLDPGRWTKLGVKLESSGDVSEHPYLNQFRAFVQALNEDRDMALTSLKDGLKTHKAIFAADRSAALGRPVKLSELD